MLTMHDFVICVEAGPDDDDLEVRKVYEAIPDRDAQTEGMLRVIDESGED